MKPEIPKERIDTSYGPKPKADKLQMSYMIYGLAYVLTLGEILKRMENHQMANIVYLVLTGIAVIFGLIVALHNRKKDNPAFSWSMWYSASGCMIFMAFIYHGGSW